MLQKIVLRDAAAKRWFVLDDPVDVLVAADAFEVIAVLEEAERRVRSEGLHAAGFVTYEAATAFDPAYVTHPRGQLPLTCFGLFRAPHSTSDLPAPALPPPPYSVWRMPTARADYVARIAAIKDQIARGNTYQVNYTVRQHSDDVVDAWALFLSVASDAPYAAYVQCEDHAIVSASPELFFEMNEERLTCKPMKGTAPRGMTQRHDVALRERLRRSLKDRAENVMIADMVRNDLGRIAKAGSVRADRLFDVEKYRTVWQMTSTVTAVSRAGLAEVFRALFPCASVTGAPKVSSMKLIAGLEESPREIYTGAIGFLAPGRQARFSVAIRTAWIDRKTSRGTYGVGGGIVWDSDPQDEYDECLNKAKVLTGGAEARHFSLLETLLWTPGESWFLLDAHLRRMAESADYFDFEFDREALVSGLEELALGLPDRPHRIRVLLRRDGFVTFDRGVLAELAGTAPLRLRLAAQPVDTGNPFLYHKTTERRVYEQARAATGDCDDVLLWNEAHEITESTIANVVVRLHGRLVTPPVDCGLLSGTFREMLLREGRISERRIPVDDLRIAEELYLVNSVRGWMPCRLAPPVGARHTGDQR
jgi:para-aminobenzoate synthetase/4-amino-4-deoxychorismate lyase